MKKKILFIFGAVAALAIGVVGISAFEAHIINVTAHIENALSTSVNELPFGTVFPQEYFIKPVTVSLSESFLAADRVDDVNYVINQKLKPCPTTIPVGIADGSPSPTPTATPTPIDPTCVKDGTTPGVDVPLEGATGWHYLNLCPFLSKGPDNSPRNDTGERSYFQGDRCIAPTPQDGAIGRLSKAEGDFSDTWNIDLKVPPIAGSVGQDWPAGCPTVPTDSATYGCDLWFEVTDISTPGETGTLTVNKILSPSEDPGKFNLQIDGVTKGTDQGNGGTTGAQTVSAGPHTVGEIAGTDTNLSNYTTVIGGDCASNGNITVPSGGSKTCTITNTRIVDHGTLTVHKVVENNGVGTKQASDFQMKIDGGNVAQDTPISETVGSHTVSEADNFGYVTTYSAECPAGVANVTKDNNTTCTVTNTYPAGTLTVHKVVVDLGGIGTKVKGDFTMTIDDNNVAQDTPIPVTTGNHTVSETNQFGYIKTYTAGDCDASGVVNVGNGQNKTCTITNTMPFGTITVTKTVTNDDGGLLTVDSFTLRIDGSIVTSGVAKNVAVGAHNVDEDGIFGYAASVGGDCDVSGNVTVAAGQNKFCTINNNDIRPSIQLVKHVVGGSAAPDDFDVSIDHVIKTSSSSNPVSANFAHVIDEEVLVSGYSFTSITGSSFLGVSCPAALEGTITLLPGDVVTCTITNTKP